MAEAVSSSSDAVASAASAGMTLWGFLDSHPWLLPATLAAATFVVCLWRCAVFYVKSSRMELDLVKAQKDRDDAKNKERDLGEELEEIRRQVVVDGLVYFVHDPLPRYPLCPSCLADGKAIRMVRNGSRIIKEQVEEIQLAQQIGIEWDTNLVGNDVHFGFICVKCGCRVYLGQRDLAAVTEHHGQVFL